MLQLVELILDSGLEFKDIQMDHLKQKTIVQTMYLLEYLGITVHIHLDGMDCGFFQWMATFQKMVMQVVVTAMVKMMFQLYLKGDVLFQS